MVTRSQERRQAQPVTAKLEFSADGDGAGDDAAGLGLTDGDPVAPVEEELELVAPGEGVDEPPDVDELTDVDELLGVGDPPPPLGVGLVLVVYVLPSAE